jgi:hypothetical protein
MFSLLTHSIQIDLYSSTAPDTCVTASGNCTHADRTCDDNNFCTKNDTCIPETGCVFQLPVPDCCGNAECEADETEMSCPLDCGDSLTTSFDTSLARSVDLVSSSVTRI